MSKQTRILMAGVALAIIGVGFGLLALFRVQQAKEFRRPRHVVMRDRTSYVLQLVEVTVGKIESGFVLIVDMRLENPNPFEVTLRRSRFVLAGHERNYYQPSTTGTQGELIKLPANGVLEREMLSYTVPEEVVAGPLTLRIGRGNTILLKEAGSPGTKLRNGEFHAFRRPSW